MGVEVGKKFSRSALSLFALADVFEKNEKKNKTAFVYRLSSFRTPFQRFSNGLWYLWGGGGGGYFRTFWVGICRWDP